MNRGAKRLAGWVGAGVLVSALAVPGCGVPSREHETVHGGEERSWHLYVPPGLPADRAVPLVVVLHGGGGNGRQLERFLEFDALADREGFLVVYPDGLDRGWNDGRGSGSVESQRAGVDDAGFLIAMIDEIAARHRVDPDRVYVTGISNGGFMSHALANRFPSRIAAIAPIVGGMAPAVAAGFGSGAVAVLILQGTDDPLVPYSGGTVARDRGACIDTVAAAKLW
ncbi:MAG: alpha/beta fold hydrolase, partial [Candidatus Brocadiae bacterium]|nr:alpha/beta fold hydrolase [Candidatus Brocadiia bacterium]